MDITTQYQGVGRKRPAGANSLEFAAERSEVYRSALCLSRGESPRRYPVFSLLQRQNLLLGLSKQVFFDRHAHAIPLSRARADL